MRRAMWIPAILLLILSGCGADWFPAIGPDSPTSITVTASPSSPHVGGSVTITATLKKADGTAVPDGTKVNFSTTSGTLSAFSGTTSGGTATVTLTSTTASSCTVTVSSGTVSGNVTVAFLPLLTLTASPSSVSSLVGGTSTITATVKDASGNAVSDGTTVNFSSLGGSLSATSSTTSGGTATVTLTIFPGTASGSVFIISATSGTSTNTTTVSVI